MPDNLQTYYVYILRCADYSYYTGVTNDIDRRLLEYQDGINPKSYTFSRRPINLVFIETFHDIELVIAYEKKIKNWSISKKEALIKKDWDKLHELAKCKNMSAHINFRKD